MYDWILILHNAVRWLVLVALVVAILKSFNGWLGKKQFSTLDNSLRHWTATLSHIQLVLGMLLYIKSPLVKFFWGNKAEAMQDAEFLFFGVVHAALMLAAIVLITVGSAMAKRKSSDIEKYKTMFIWFVIALLIIFVAIPWPFSPLANRPYIRTF